jgi:hypothetical protein
MTVGAEPQMYPYLMADEARWPESMTFVNCSLPGITAADACAFFFDYLSRAAAPRAVVLSLGTCDAMSSEVRKGRYTLARQVANSTRRRLGRAPARARLRNRLLHFEWNGDLDPSIEQPESAEDFAFNLDRILKACRSRSIGAVLVRPKSNPLFPPGVGKGNFVFYSHIGIPARVADRLSIPEPRFVEAMRHVERGAFAEGAALFKAMLSTTGPLSAHPEFPMILVNNYAAAVAGAGRLDEARSVLTLLLKERGARREIILFNLAQIATAAGRNDESATLRRESYEADQSLYRIRQPYLDAIDGLRRKYGGTVETLDLQALLDDLGFVDHCHALPGGQRQIAQAMNARLAALGLAGSHPAVIRNDLRNPELAKGIDTEFFTYFRSYGAMTPEAIRRNMERLRTGAAARSPHAGESALGAAPEELARAIEYYLRHPMFPTAEDVFRIGPEYPSDIGRFPELFLVRHVIPYLREAEREPALAARFNPEIGVLRSADALTRILPADVVPLIRSEMPVGDAATESAYVDRVLTRAASDLARHLRSGNQVYERVKTTLFWYFREVLRYGSHSRVSMRYERTVLEHIAEALAVASIIDVRLRLGRSHDILRLIGVLERAVAVHDRYCAQVSLAGDMTGLLAEYDATLFALAGTVERAPALQ